MYWGRQEGYHVGVSLVAQMWIRLLSECGQSRGWRARAKQRFESQLRVVSRGFQHHQQAQNRTRMITESAYVLKACPFQIGGSSIHVRAGYMRQQDMATHDCGEG